MNESEGKHSTKISVINASLDIGKTLIGALPPSFVMLCVINMVFLMMVVWFIHDQNDIMRERTRVVGDIVTACIAKLN